jgi:endoglucanase
VATAVGTLAGHGLAATIDMHPSGDLLAGFASDPHAACSEVELAWQALAPALADLPEATSAELLNEPPLWSDRWLPLRDRLAAVVRAAAPRIPITWGAGRYQTIGETIGAPLLADPNAVVAVHYYAPMGFTHQCESWSGSVYARFRDLPFPAAPDSPAITDLRRSLAAAGDSEAAQTLDEEHAAPWTTARIDADFAQLADWAAANAQRVSVNEFGVLGFCADPLSRRTWLAAVRRAAERHGFGWAVWELDHGFGIMADRRDAASLDLDLVDSLTGSGP